MRPLDIKSAIVPFALFSLVSPLAACSVGADSADPPAFIEPAAPPEKGVVTADFVVHLSPRDRSMTFHQARRKAPRPALHAQDLNADEDSLVVAQDDEEGSGPINTVELVDNFVGIGEDCAALGYPTDSFCANVTLRHFLGRPLSDVFIQATSVYDEDGNLLPDHGGLNSSPSEHGLDDSWGLWKYTGEGVATAGVLGQNGPFNAGSANWVFGNPDDADTWIVLRVVASMRYTDYSVAPAAIDFIDACAVGSSVTSSSSTQSMPFPFSFWETTSSTVNFNKRGMVTFGDTPGTASGENECLPSATAPAPALFPFWDNLTFGPNGRMCWATIGAEPNRQFVIQWSDMDFVSDDPESSDVGSSLTFETILSEGTNRIDLVYGDMRAPEGSSSRRPSGSSATVGLQNSTGTEAPGAVCGGTSYGSGSSFTFSPLP